MLKSISNDGDSGDLRSDFDAIRTAGRWQVKCGKDCRFFKMRFFLLIILNCQAETRHVINQEQHWVDDTLKSAGESIIRLCSGIGADLVIKPSSGSPAI